MVVGGDRSDLRVADGYFRIERGQVKMLLVLLRAVIAAREREDQGIIVSGAAAPR
jgi:hypothetical protein